MKRASELIPGNQDTNSQRPYRTHTLLTCRVCIEAEQPLKFNQPREIRTIQVIGHLIKRGLPLSSNQKEKKKKNTKNNRKRKREKEKKKKNDKNRYKYRNKRDHSIGIPGTV